MQDSWKSNVKSEESIKNTGLDNTFAPSLLNHRALSLSKLSGNCLRMNLISVH